MDKHEKLKKAARKAFRQMQALAPDALRHIEMFDGRVRRPHTDIALPTLKGFEINGQHYSPLLSADLTAKKIARIVRERCLDIILSGVGNADKEEIEAYRYGELNRHLAGEGGHEPVITQDFMRRGLGSYKQGLDAPAIDHDLIESLRAEADKAQAAPTTEDWARLALEVLKRIDPDKFEGAQARNGNNGMICLDSIDEDCTYAIAPTDSDNLAAALILSHLRAHITAKTKSLAKKLLAEWAETL